MHPILEMITKQQALIAATVTNLRNQVNNLTDELRLAETELSELATTRATITRLTSGNGFPPPDKGSFENAVYQQIVAAFEGNSEPTMRSKDVCRSLGIGIDHKDVEATRSKLKRLVRLGILVEIEAGQFALNKPQADR